MRKAENFKFCTEMDGREYYQKCKIRSKGVTWESRDPLLQFWDPQISREQLKPDTSNLAQVWMAVSTNEKNAKFIQKGSCSGHVTYFWNFGTPNISGRMKLKTSNLAQIWRAVSTNKKMQNLF